MTIVINIIRSVWVDNLYVAFWHFSSLARRNGVWGDVRWNTVERGSNPNPSESATQHRRSGAELCAANSRFADSVSEKNKRRIRWRSHHRLLQMQYAILTIMNE